MKAISGRVIVKFRKYRREGVMVLPDRHMPESVEGEIVHDSEGEWEPGLQVICSRMDGIYHELDGVNYCTLKRKSVFMAFTEKDGKIDTLRPLQRAVITTNEEPIRKDGGFFIPEMLTRFENKGKVLAVGPGEWDFSEGAVVHFDQKQAAAIKIDGRDAMYVPEKLIVAVEEEVAA